MKRDKLFEECLAKVPPEVMREVSDNIDKLIADEAEEFEQEWKKYCDSKGGGAVTMNVKDVAQHFAKYGYEQAQQDLMEKFKMWVAYNGYTAKDAEVVYNDFKQFMTEN